MMTKEQFIKQAGVIVDYIAAQRKAGEFINKNFFSGSTTSVFDFGNDLITLAIEQLSEISGIYMESIELCVYGNGGICQHTDGFEMNVQTLDDLWEFEKHEVKNKK